VLCTAFLCLSDWPMLPLYTALFCIVPFCLKLNDDDDDDGEGGVPSGGREREEVREREGSEKEQEGDWKGGMGKWGRRERVTGYVACSRKMQIEPISHIMSAFIST